MAPIPRPLIVGGIGMRAQLIMGFSPVSRRWQPSPNLRGVRRAKARPACFVNDGCGRRAAWRRRDPCSVGRWTKRTPGATHARRRHPTRPWRRFWGPSWRLHPSRGRVSRRGVSVVAIASPQSERARATNPYHKPTKLTSPMVPNHPYPRYSR